MTIEARTGQEQQEVSQTIQVVIEPRYKFGAKAVEQVLSSPNFRERYPESIELERKYSIAHALVENGAYENPLSLLHGFMPIPSVMRGLSPDQQQTLRKQGKELKDSLTIFLMQKGVLDPDSEEAKDARDEVTRIIDRNELLQKLREVLPIHVMGAVTNILLFENISDREKREKLRGWTTKALLRPYLGDIAIQPQRGDIDFRNLIDLVPEQIFRNAGDVTLKIARSYFSLQAMKLFNEGDDLGYQRLNSAIQEEMSDVKKEFLQEVFEEMEKDDRVEIPDKFVSTVETWVGEASPFPHRLQRRFARVFQERKRALLNGATGTGKTGGGGLLGMEVAGAKKPTIFGPAKARNTWPREAEKIYEKEKPEVFRVRNEKDLLDPRLVSSQFVYVSAELLGRAWNDPRLYSLVESAVANRRNTDGLILDESHEFRNQDANCSRMLQKLITDIRDKYESDGLSTLPIMALTATPITSSLEDVDATMALLYPERFALPGVHEEGKYPFSVQALKDPQIAYSLFFGEELLVQWKLEDMYGDKIQKSEFSSEERVRIPLSPSERVIYDWTSELPIGTLAKIRLLRSTLLNPEMIKKTCRERGLIPEDIPSTETLSARLDELHAAWTQWILEKDPRIPDEPFSADWVAKFDREFILNCFFNPNLVDGVEALARRSLIIRQDWQEKTSVSGKYEYARRAIENALTKDENGNYVARKKIFFVSPYHRRGITRYLEDPDLKDTDFDDDTLSFFEYKFIWFPGLPIKMATNIDGTKSFESRDRAAQKWREEGDENVIIDATMDSVNESGDWAVRDLERNKNIEEIELHYLGLPYSWEEKQQMDGRVLRPGLGKKVKVFFYEADGTIDQGFFDLVRRKYLLTQIALSGIQLDPEDQEFFKKSTEAQRILLTQPNIGHFFLQNVIQRLKGRGETEGIEEFSRKKDGKTFFELFAEFYFDEGRDEFRLVGNNAELMKNIALRSHPERVVSVGAGSCLFARKMREAGYEGEIDNVDINGSVLRLAKEKYPNIGNLIIEGASHMTVPSELYDVADYSFVIPWTKLYDASEKIEKNVSEVERIKVLSEMNRVLKVGGIAILSFPDSSFDEETFSNFTAAMTNNFGFSVLSPSGISHATDVQPHKRIGWVITLQKTGNINLSGFDPKTIAFSNEGLMISRYKQRKDRKPTVIEVDYPIFSSKAFEVFNPITHERTNANGMPKDEESVLYNSPQEIVRGIKEQLFKEEAKYRTWNGLRRDIEKSLGYNYAQAEEVLAGILRRRGMDDLAGWQAENLQRIVASEIRRFQRQNGREGHSEGGIQ